MNTSGLLFLRFGQIRGNLVRTSPVYVILTALVLILSFLPLNVMASGSHELNPGVKQRVAQADTKGAPNSQPAVAGSQTTENQRRGTSGMTTSIQFMLIFVAGIVVLFLWEPVPLYVIALLIPCVLVVCKEVSGISVEQALSGFSSEATITILAMFILSQGIQNTGLIQMIGEKISSFTGSSEIRQLGVITALSGPTAGIINNTPVVAIFIPMVSNMARRLKTSPSKLMIPLSYASMMGGTLTLIGSSSNLLASDLSEDLLNHPIGFFEFTVVGVVILVTGSLYLIFLSGWLIPERIDPEKDLAEEYEMGNLLTELVLHEDSSLIGQSVGESFAMLNVDLDLVQIIRDDEKFMEPLQEKTLREGDRLIVRTGRAHLMELLNMDGIRLWSRDRVTEEQLEEPVKGQTMIETVIPSGSFLEGQNLKDVNFVERYDATVLAVRRGEELTHSRMDELTIHAGDVLLLMATETTLNRLRENQNFIVAEEIRKEQYEQSKIPIALGIFGAVIASAATGMMPISISALGGGILMYLTGCVEANELHESVDWEVLFLLAGLIPLGIAMEQTGTAKYLALKALPIASQLSTLGALALFYLITVVMTNLIHKNASIVLMIPIAVDAAARMNLEPFPFLITVMLAASTAFLTPVGNHTNLMVYGPGGYRFTDFLKVGTPLQILLAIVTPITVWLLWM